MTSPRKPSNDAQPRKGNRWTAEQRTEALRIYLALGAGEAERQTGIPSASVRRWARADGITTVAQQANAAATRAAILRRRRSAEERRTALVEKLGELAELGVDLTLEVVTTDVSVHDLVGVWTRAIHDLQLLTGGATARTETRDLAGADDVRRLRDELAAKRAERAAQAAGEATGTDGAR